MEFCVRRALKTGKKFEDKISYEISSLNGTPEIAGDDEWALLD